MGVGGEAVGRVTNEARLGARHDALMPDGSRRFVPFAECASKAAMKSRNAGARRHPTGLLRAVPAMARLLPRIRSTRLMFYGRGEDERAWKDH